MFHYLNNAGAGMLSPETLRTTTEHLQLEAQIGASGAAQKQKLAAEAFYDRAKELINAKQADEIAYMDSASRAWDMAVYGTQLTRGDKVLTLSSEFGTNLIALFDYALRVGAQVEVLPCDIQGFFDINRVAESLSKGVALVALSQVAAHGSIVNPVLEISQLVRDTRALFIVDGCQAAGQLPIDVQLLACDAYVTTGRKWLRGPRGTGFLYVRNGGRMRSPYFDLSGADLILEGDTRHVAGISVRPDARQYELWERSLASMLGLSTAMGQYLERAREIDAKIHGDAQRIRDSVFSNEAYQGMGQQNVQCGITGFYLSDPSREPDFEACLSANDLEISKMKDWDCPLHFPQNGASTIYRVSPHSYTPQQTVDVACEVLSSFK